MKSETHRTLRINVYCKYKEKALNILERTRKWNYIGSLSETLFFLNQGMFAIHIIYSHFGECIKPFFLFLFPFAPLPLLFQFLYNLSYNYPYYLCQLMFMAYNVTLIDNIRILNMAHINPLVSLFLPSHPSTLFPWVTFILGEICSLAPFYPSLIIFFVCTFPHSDERCRIVLKPVYLIYFTQYYNFHLRPFSHKCLKFVILCRLVVFHYIQILHFLCPFIFDEYIVHFQDLAITNCDAVNNGMYTWLQNDDLNSGGKIAELLGHMEFRISLL